MTVLVLRPAPSCFELVNMLEKANISAIAAPLLSFEAGGELAQLKDKLNSLPANSIVVAVSPRAIEYANQILTEKDWPEDLHYVAVGQKTAQRWKECSNIKASTPTTQSSEGLLTLNIFNQLKGKNILILRGNGGRNFLAKELTKSGAIVNHIELYRRIWNTDKVLSQIKSWQEKNIKTLVISSGEQLKLLWKSLDKSSRHWLCQCQLFVPSERIYQQAQFLGFKTVFNVKSASNTALFNALNTFLILDNTR